MSWYSCGVCHAQQPVTSLYSLGLLGSCSQVLTCGYACNQRFCHACAFTLGTWGSQQNWKTHSKLGHRCFLCFAEVYQYFKGIKSSHHLVYLNLYQQWQADIFRELNPLLPVLLPPLLSIFLSLFYCSQPDVVSLFTCGCAQGFCQSCAFTLGTWGSPQNWRHPRQLPHRCFTCFVEHNNFFLRVEPQLHKKLQDQYQLWQADLFRVLHPLLPLLPPLVGIVIDYVFSSKKK